MLIVVKRLELNSNGLLTILCDFSSDEQFYHVEIFDPNSREILFERSLPIAERAIEIDVRKHLHSFPLTYLICLRIRHDRSCRNVDYRRTPLARLASSISTSSDRYLHFLIGAILGGAIICFVLLLLCFIRDSSLISMRKPSKYLFPRDRTSECSFGVSSASTTADPYHIYQQITALNSCPHHRLRTEPIYL